MPTPSALPDQAILHLLRLYRETEAKHPTIKSAQIASARLDTACQLAAYVTGHNVAHAIRAALEETTTEIGNPLGPGWGDIARAERDATLIASVIDNLSKDRGYTQETGR